MKKLYRSSENKMIAGVCAGIAQYFDIDETIVRLLWVFLTVFSASVPGVLIYIICIFIIPVEPEGIDVTGYYADENSQQGAAQGHNQGDGTDFYYKG